MAELKRHGNKFWLDLVGGLVGFVYDGTIMDGFWNTDTQTHGVLYAIGLRRTGEEADVAGLSTSQLHQQSTFTDWDFINTWDIGENQTYPYLRTHSPGDINKDHITNFLDLCIMAERLMSDE